MKKIFLILGMMFILLSVLVSANNLTVGLTGYYTMDVNGSFDDSLNQTNGTIFGDPVFTESGKVNGGYNSNGVDDYINFGNNFNMGDAFSFSLWIKTADTDGRFIFKNTVAPNRAYYFYLTNGKPAYFLSDDGTSSLANAVFVGADFINDSTFHHIVVAYNGSAPNIKLYDNGVLMGTSTSSIPSSINENSVDMTFMSQSGTNLVTATFDELAFYNRTLTPDEVTILYNSNLGLQYPFTDIPATHNYTVTTIQDPVNLTVQSIGNLTINASVTDSVGNISNLTSPFSTLNFNVISEGNYNCTFIYGYNNSCVVVDESYSMTKINNSYYTYSQSENSYLPTYYPFDEIWVEEQVKSDYELTNSNVFKFQINNFTTNPLVATYIEYNIDYETILFDDPLFVKLCPYNYTSGDILFSENCTTIDVLPVGTPFNHCHNNNLSCHHVTRISQDLVVANNNSLVYIAFGSTSTNPNSRWNARYTTNTSFASGDNVFQVSDDLGLTWTNSTLLFDVHLHQFKEDDGINYSVTFNDNDSETKDSVTVFDNFDILKTAPSSVNILSPVIGSTITLYSVGKDIFFNWTESIDPDGDNVYYAVALGNGVPLFNLTTGLTVTNYTHTFTSSDLNSQAYRTYVYSYDIGGRTTLSPDNGTFNICINDWYASEGVCVGSVANVTYIDMNSCPIEYEKPASYLTNCSYTNQSSIDWFFIVLIMFVLLILIVLSIWLHPLFLGLAGILLAVFTPTTLLDITENVLFMVLMFLVSGVFLIASVVIWMTKKDGE